MKQNNDSVWNDIALCFSPTEDVNEYAPGTENFSVVWPILQPIINDVCSINPNASLLDFGCGTGIFAEAISKHCSSVYACDNSRNMISAAINNSTGNVLYELGGIDFVQKCSRFSLIVSIMVFQFIDNIEETIHILCDATADSGYIFFATHDIDYVNECLSHNCKFRNIHSTGCQLDGEIHISNRWIRTYVRSEGEYEKIFNQYGFEKIASIKKHLAPPFELNFSTPWKSNKYYIAWYRKKIK